MNVVGTDLGEMLNSAQKVRHTNIAGCGRCILDLGPGRFNDHRSWAPFGSNTPEIGLHWNGSNNIQTRWILVIIWIIQIWIGWSDLSEDLEASLLKSKMSESTNSRVMQNQCMDMNGHTKCDNRDKWKGW
jgi:hypothetical protein